LTHPASHGEISQVDSASLIFLGAGSVKASPVPPQLEILDNVTLFNAAEIRPALVRVLTHFYVHKPTHTSAEERQYTELVLRLLDSVDIGTRKLVAARLANYPAAPAEVVRRLARDVLEVASPILERSQSLSGPDLLAIIAERGLRYAAEISHRLPIRAESKTVAAEHVSAAGEFRHLETTALERKPAEFARTLERALGISTTYAQRIVADEGGEPLLVAAKALGMPTDAFLRIILLLNPIIGKSLVRVFGLAKLYDALPRETALRLVASLRSARAGNGPALVCRKAPKEAPEADCALDCLAQRHR